MEIISKAKKYILLLILVFLSLSTIEAKIKSMVVPFLNDDGENFTQKFRSELRGRKIYNVINAEEFINMRELLSEQDRDSFVREHLLDLSKKYGAKVLFMGSVKKLNRDDSMVSIKRVDVESGRLDTSTSAVFSSKDSDKYGKIVEMADIISEKTFKVKELHKFRGHNQAVSFVAFSPDGEYIYSAGKDRVVSIWSMQSGSLIKSIDNCGNYTIVSPDGKYIFTGGTEKDMRLIDIESSKTLFKFKSDNTSQLFSASFSFDGKYIVTVGQDYAIRLWDLATGGLVRVFDGEKKFTNSVVFSADSKYVFSGGTDKVIYAYDVSTGNFLKNLHFHDRAITFMSSRQDSRYILSCDSENKLYLWDSEEFTIKKTISGSSYYSSKFNAAAMFPDGDYILTGSEEYMKIYDVEDGDSIESRYVKHALSSAVSPDGKYIVLGLKNCYLEIWQIFK